MRNRLPGSGLMNNGFAFGGEIMCPNVISFIYNRQHSAELLPQWKHQRVTRTNGSKSTTGQ